MLNTLMINAVNRGVSTVVSSGLTIILARCLRPLKLDPPLTFTLSVPVPGVSRHSLVLPLSRSKQQTYVPFPDVAICSPFSAVYMNSMLATLNMRQQVRDKVLSNDLG